VLSDGKQKYYIVVMLVEVTTVDQLVDRLKKGKYRDSESVLADSACPPVVLTTRTLTSRTVRRQAAEDDDDIVSGAQKMSLRDPITMVRVGTPTRSARCVHPACFDAPTWFMMMESTTTWQCPICDKLLDPDDLLVDGSVFPSARPRRR
jgi:E3 SUMO-protein ligase PIAS1